MQMSPNENKSNIIIDERDIHQVEICTLAITTDSYLPVGDQNGRQTHKTHVPTDPDG